MALGIPEIAIVTAGIAVTLWLLPRSLPEVARALRQFREELRKKEPVGADQKKPE